MEAREFDVVVLGAGPIGQNVAERARAAGLDVAVVERELVGGECSYRACVPSKALLRPVIALADARRVDGARAALTGSLAVEGVFARRNRDVSDWDDSGQADWVGGIGAALGARPRATGRTAPRRRRRFRAAGADRPARRGGVHRKPARAARPAGHRGGRTVDQRAGHRQSAVPERLAVLGAGGVGVEMATAWQGLGSEVTLPAWGPGQLPRMEPFVGELIHRGLVDAGMDVRVGVSVRALRHPKDESVILELDDGTELRVSEILFATGRAPLNDDIGLETAGLTPGAWLDVDDTCRARGIGDGWL